jgi:poly(A) polymerase
LNARRATLAEDGPFVSFNLRSSIVHLQSGGIMARPRSEREFAVQVVRALRDAGHEALFAGGCVRDEVLGLMPKDYDVATSARPEQVQALFPRTVAVGAAFGVIEVLGPRPYSIEVATFRSDGDYSDGRRPDSVVFCSAEEDARRRDFTINGMFFDPIAERLIDHVGGRADLDARVLRAIGEPRERFREDRLRMLRAVRMAARFDLAVDPTTASAIVEMAAQLGDGVSAERIAEELRKMLVDPRRTRAMRLFADLGLAAVVMPELLPMRGLPQGLPRPDGPALPPPGRPGSESPSDLYEHVLRVLDLLGEEPSFPLAMAALLHDVGKPRTVGRTPDRYTFHAHEHVGRRMANEMCLRLKLSTDERERIEWLVEKHQVLADAPQMRPAKLKVLLVHKGIDELLMLHRADALASGRTLDHVEYTEQKRREWLADGTLDPDPIVTGNDLMEMGLTPGPRFKTLLAKVREAQLDGTIRTKEEAIALVRKLLEELDS